jgi:TonB family protein
MKSLALLIAVAVLPVAASAETEVRRDGTIEYEKDELRWDKKAFDLPPQIVGGYADLIRRVSYPPELRARRVEGAATATVSLDAAGQVRSVTFTPRMPPDLERIVTAAVRGCRWKPGERHRKAVSGRVWFPVKFVVRNP